VAPGEAATPSGTLQAQVQEAYDSHNDRFKQVLARAAEALRDSLCVAQQSFDEQLEHLLDARSEPEGTGEQYLRFQPALIAAEEAFGRARELLEQVERSATDAAVSAFASPKKPAPPAEAPPEPPADPIAVTDQLMERAIGSLDGAMEAIVKAIDPYTTGPQTDETAPNGE
jgi:hypothetical protein